MTKAEIVQVIYGRLGGFSKKEAADLVDMVFETMKETLAKGEKIKISGFGNFVLRDKRQRQGRNPQTGNPIVITERRVLNFKASQILKQGLNPKKGSSHSEGGHGTSLKDGPNRSLDGHPSQHGSAGSVGSAGRAGNNAQSSASQVSSQASGRGAIVED